LRRLPCCRLLLLLLLRFLKLVDDHFCPLEGLLRLGLVLLLLLLVIDRLRCSKLQTSSPAARVLTNTTDVTQTQGGMATANITINCCLHAVAALCMVSMQQVQSSSHGQLYSLL
jgi:hypothetical protein